MSARASSAAAPIIAKPYEICRAAELAENTAPLVWLADELFLQAGAGILAGSPKSMKSYFALELCVAIASATPCAGRFAVARKGPVLLLCAEDPDAVVVDRLTSLARSRDLDLAALPIDLIVERGVLLPDGVDRLAATVQRSAPKLLVLDPLIRCHHADENSATEMSVILDGLRHLARQTRTAVLLVHHTRKAPAGAAGATMRGSSDLWAFGDTNLYLRKLTDTIELKIEHRASLAPPAVRLKLVATDGVASFRPATDDPEPDLVCNVLDALCRAGAPIPSAKLRELFGVRNQLVTDVLHRLHQQGRVRREGRRGWIAITNI